MHNAAVVRFNDLPKARISHFGIWDMGGNFVGGWEFEKAKTLGDEDNFEIVAPMHFNFFTERADLEFIFVFMAALFERFKRLEIRAWRGGKEVVVMLEESVVPDRLHSRASETDPIGFEP